MAGADTDAERRRLFEQRWRVRRTYADYREMLSAERPEIVSLTAYAPERFAMYKACIDSGVRAIWIEKAIATSLKEAKSRVRLAKRSGTTTVVNHGRRWNPKYKAAKKLIEIGAIGVPESIVSTFSGRLIHSGTHAFDVMRFLFGEAVSVRGTPDPAALPDANGRFAADIGGSGTIRFENGVLGIVNGRAKHYFVFEFEILGSEGMIRLGNTAPLALFQPAPASYATGFTDLTPVPLPEGVARLNAARRRGGPVSDLLRGLTHGLESTNSVREGLKALEIALAFHESFGAGVPKSRSLSPEAR